MAETVYKGCSIRSQTWILPSGGVGCKVLVRPCDDKAGGAHLVMLPERWATEDEVGRGAIEAGKRLVDSGAVRVAKARGGA